MCHLFVQISAAFIETSIFLIIYQPILQITDKTDRLRGRSEKIIACQKHNGPSTIVDPENRSGILVLLLCAKLAEIW